MKDLSAMQKFYKIMTLTLLCVMPLTAIQSQEYTSNQYTNNACCGEPEASCAYNDSCRTAHWSVYVPIGIVVVAAVLFGLADGTSSSTSGSQNGLGSMKHSSSAKKCHTNHSSHY